VHSNFYAKKLLIALVIVAAIAIPIGIYTWPRTH